MFEDIKGKCSCCGKTDSKFDYIGVRVKKFYCSEECRKILVNKYYEDKEKVDNIYYSNIPQYDDDDGWGY